MRLGQALLQLINDILDLSKIEAGRVEVERLPCSPWQIVEEVLSLLRLRADEKKFALAADYRFPLPVTIPSDPVRLRQILVNLVGNAIKFTEGGGVRIVVSFQAGPPARLCFAVEDTGMGIAEEGLTRLFQPFSQVDTSHTRRFGGTGLGLAICKRLAELLRGNITVESAADMGSTFTLALELEEVEHIDLIHRDPSLIFSDQVKPATAQGLLQGRVLLAEDAPDNQALLRLILHKTGLEVDVADNGHIACTLAAASAAVGRPFDLILMDVQMPVMDGFRATEQLRRFGWQGRIVALTAHAMASDRQRCLAAGCDDYLSKPVTSQRLYEMLRRYLKPQHRPPEPPPDASAHRRPGLLDDLQAAPAERARLTALFQTNVQKRLAEIEEAMRNGDRERLAGAAHGNGRGGGHVWLPSAHRGRPGPGGTGACRSRFFRALPAGVEGVAPGTASRGTVIRRAACPRVVTPCHRSPRTRFAGAPPLSFPAARDRIHHAAGEKCSTPNSPELLRSNYARFASARDWSKVPTSVAVDSLSVIVPRALSTIRGSRAELGGDESSVFVTSRGMPPGTIKRWLRSRGVVVFRGERGDLFFHRSSIEGARIATIRVGRWMTHEAGRGLKGPRAKPVRHA